MGRPVLPALLCAVAALPARAEGDAPADTMNQVVVVAPLSRDVRIADLCPIANSTFRMQEVEKMRITDVKELSALVPNLHIPDYGSRMTSSVYVRGLGSRIDQPAMGVYVDGVPLLNKNTYDFPLLDVRSIAVLRGPQNTLYGRNSMGGVMDIKTLSPLSYEGTRIMAEGGNGNTWRGRVSTYRRLKENLGFSVAAHGALSDGYYVNQYKNANCDWSRNAGLNLRLEGQGRALHWTAFSDLDWVNQGGFPYRLLEQGTDRLLPVRYNDRCAYHRLAWRAGVSLEGQWERYKFSSVTSYQLVDDAMQMDQDFTPQPVFTLRQAQKDHTRNQDFTLRPIHSKERWDWLTGANLWGRQLRTAAPVVFKRDGIQRLILDNANAGIQKIFPDDTLSIDADRLPVESFFTQRYYGISLYHHSVVRLAPEWKLTLGGRVEYEGQQFRYDSGAEVRYHIASPDGDIDRHSVVQIAGTQTAHYFQWAPKAAVTYTRGHTSWHASVGRGFKAGGFNTQLFSDLVQQKLSAEIMRNYVTVNDNVDVKRTTRYKPEHSWNFDAGFKWEKQRDYVAATLFFTDCRDQQLTVFPDGMQTGRMMTNAGHSRIFGAELEGAKHWGNLMLQASYGYTHAVFADYPDGNTNYRGSFIPYVPQHTLMAGADWNVPLKDERYALTLHADVRGVGPLYWDEENSVRQDFYALLNASVRLSYDSYALTLWGRNLTDTRYSTFYFVSMKNRFLQQGKPLQFGATLTWNF